MGNSTTPFPPPISHSRSSTSLTSSTSSSSRTPPSSTSSHTSKPSVVTTTNVVTSHNSGSLVTTTFTSFETSSTHHSKHTTAAAALQNSGDDGSSGGLSSAGKIAIAVVIPVVVVALLAVAGIFLWRRYKARKAAEEARRKEISDYSYNPNADPTLPVVGGVAGSEMHEDTSSGYRGWGSTNLSNRKGSTTMSGGGLTATALSDNGSNTGGYYAVSPHSPHATNSDGHSADPLVASKRDTLDSDGMGSLGPATGTMRGGGPSPGVVSGGQAGMQRGPSNASSSYSAGNVSEESGGGSVPRGFYDEGAAANGQPGGGYGSGAQPVIQDVSARRNTRIESPTVFPQQGSTGISQNF